MPLLAPLILQFKESKSKSRRKLDNKIRSASNKNEVDKQLTLEMEELDDDMSDYDDGDDLADENEAEGKEEHLNGNLFELSEPIRNFVNFWTAPIVKFFYFQVDLRIIHFLKSYFW